MHAFVLRIHATAAEAGIGRHCQDGFLHEKVAAYMKSELGRQCHVAYSMHSTTVEALERPSARACFFFC